MTRLMTKPAPQAKDEPKDEKERREAARRMTPAEAARDHAAQSAERTAKEMDRRLDEQEATGRPWRPPHEINTDPLPGTLPQPNSGSPVVHPSQGHQQPSLLSAPDEDALKEQAKERNITPILPGETPEQHAERAKLVEAEREKARAERRKRAGEAEKQAAPSKRDERLGHQHHKEGV